MAKPHCSVLGFCWTITSPSSLTVLVLAREGMPTPTVPVIASGRRYFVSSGRSPNPLPNSQVGVKVLKVSAPTRFDPLPPMSQSMPSDRIASCESVLKRQAKSPFGASLARRHSLGS